MPGSPRSSGETIQLYFFEGYALKEIAEATGRSIVNVRSHYYRGLEADEEIRSARKAAVKVSKTPQNGSAQGT